MKPVTGRSRAGPGRRAVLLLTSATVSRLADEAAGIALVLAVIARTHDPRLAGLVVAAFTVPTLVSGPVLGAYLDRMRARQLLFAGNQLMLAAALTGVALLAGRTSGLVLIVLGLCAGLTAPVLTGGFSSLIPLVVPAASLPRANALDSASYNVAGLAGPALVAAIAGTAGAIAALSAVAAIAAAGLVLVLAAPMPAPASRAPASSLSSALRDGLLLLWDRPLLRSATIATTLSMLAQGLLPGHPSAPCRPARPHHRRRRMAADRHQLRRPAGSPGQSSAPGPLAAPDHPDHGAGRLRRLSRRAGRDAGSQLWPWAWPSWLASLKAPPWPRP